MSTNSAPERFEKGVLFPTEDDTIATACFEKWGSKDPFPDVDPSLLNSADIHDYVATTGMLAPFYPASLKSASYEAALLGDLIWWDDKKEPHHQNLQENQPFELKANSVAFVSVEPKFRIPDYIALRFNLRITLIHRGLLLGTGPLVDPGFVGKLAIPLHNLTDKPWTLKGGDPLIWIEFTKLSRHTRWDEGLRRTLASGVYYPFPEEKKHKTFFSHLDKAQGGPPLRPIRASVGEFQADLESAKNKAKETATLVRRIEYVGLAAILVTAVLGVPPILSLIQESNQYVMDARAELAITEKRLEETTRELSASQEKATELNNKIEALEGSCSQPTPANVKAPKKSDDKGSAKSR